MIYSLAYETCITYNYVSAKSREVRVLTNACCLLANCTVAPVAMTVEVEEDLCQDKVMNDCEKQQNFDVLSNLLGKLSHLTTSEQKQMMSLITELSAYFLMYQEEKTVCQCRCHEGHTN